MHSTPLSRRGLLLAGAAVASTSLCRPSIAAPAPRADVPPEDYRVANGRIRQSIMCGMFGLPANTLIDAAHRMGLPAVEAFDTKLIPRVRELGLSIGYIGGHGYVRGPLDPANHAECEKKLIAGIDLAAECGCASVITFTGMRVPGIADEQAKKNCVELWKKIMPHAEARKVNLVLEMLNTRDGSHPMKGHPGYFGHDIDLCADLARQVGSPRMKLLFDVYHVQIMNGDVIRHIRQLKDLIGHVHVAGVPGRGELDDIQELNYPAIMRALLEVGYSGFVAQEFIPTWPDKLAALRHAVRVCDV